MVIDQASTSRWCAISLKKSLSLKKAQLAPNDVVLDIGSNDATSLKAYATSGLTRIGIDPTGEKFRAYYPDDIKLVPDFSPQLILINLESNAQR